MRKPQIFALYKPANFGSTNCLSLLKKKFGKEKLGKIGHFGTLDPFAEGLFLVGINGATRLNEYIHNRFPKTYLASGSLRYSTDSGDLTGEEAKKSSLEHLAVFEKMPKEEFVRILKQKFLGQYLQKPPMYSASKHEGKPLHYYARKGQVIERKSKERFIYQLEVLKKGLDETCIRVEASSGTYIRTLFEDTVETQKLHGHLRSLVREKIGPVNLEHALKLEDIEEMSFDEFCKHGIELEKILPFPMVKIDKTAEKKFRSGQVLTSEKDSTHPWLWVCNGEGEIQGLGQSLKEGLRAKINFFPL